MVSDDDNYNEKRWRELFKVFNSIMDRILHDLGSGDQGDMHSAYDDAYGRGNVGNSDVDNIEIDDYGDEVYVIIDLSWLNPREIEILNIDKNTIYIEAYGSYETYKKAIDIPLNVDIRSREFKYRNGLLKIRFAKK